MVRGSNLARQEIFLFSKTSNHALCFSLLFKGQWDYFQSVKQSVMMLITDIHLGLGEERMAL
jgi:hypothetical protein